VKLCSGEEAARLVVSNWPVAEAVQLDVVILLGFTGRAFDIDTAECSKRFPLTSLQSETSRFGVFSVQPDALHRPPIMSIARMKMDRKSRGFLLNSDDESANGKQILTKTSDSPILSEVVLIFSFKILTQIGVRDPWAVFAQRMFLKAAVRLVVPMNRWMPTQIVRCHRRQSMSLKPGGRGSGRRRRSPTMLDNDEMPNLSRWPPAIEFRHRVTARRSRLDRGLVNISRERRSRFHGLENRSVHQRSIMF
jgi:hypothetical protein